MSSKKNTLENYKIKPAFTDKRGDILDILEEPVSHVGLVTFKKGAIRGNHYHKKSTQYTYVLYGKIKFVVSDARGKNKKSFILMERMFSRIPPKMVHSYKALTTAAMLDITTLNRKNSAYEEDTVRVTILS